MKIDSLKLLLVEHNLIPASRLKRRQKRELEAWERTQSGRLPNLLKQKIVIREAVAFGARIFVETGTYYGLMLQACWGHFDTLYSIEVEPHFHRRAKRVFRNRPNVNLLLGDSAELLPSLLQRIDSPCLFWLDVHSPGGLTGRASVDTPIGSELQAIF